MWCHRSWTNYPVAEYPTSSEVKENVQNCRVTRKQLNYFFSYALSIRSTSEVHPHHCPDAYIKCHVPYFTRLSFEVQRISSSAQQISRAATSTYTRNRTYSTNCFDIIRLGRDSGTKNNSKVGLCRYISLRDAWRKLDTTAESRIWRHYTLGKESYYLCFLVVVRDRRATSCLTFRELQIQANVLNSVSFLSLISRAWYTLSPFLSPSVMCSAMGEIP